MPDKTIDQAAAPQGMVTKQQIKALSKNFFSRLQILDHDGQHRPLDCSDPSHPQKNDTRCVYFEKSRIDALFAANPGSDGLKIFFGVHDHAIFPLPDDVKDKYHNKLMVVLVTTTIEVDNLNDEGSGDGAVESMTAPAGDGEIRGGEGLDNGKLCPPYSGC